MPQEKYSRIIIAVIAIIVVLTVVGYTIVSIRFFDAPSKHDPKPTVSAYQT